MDEKAIGWRQNTAVGNLVSLGLQGFAARIIRHVQSGRVLDVTAFAALKKESILDWENMEEERHKSAIRIRPKNVCPLEAPSETIPLPFVLTTFARLRCSFFLLSLLIMLHVKQKVSASDEQTNKWRCKMMNDEESPWRDGATAMNLVLLGFGSSPLRWCATSKVDLFSMTLLWRSSRIRPSAT